MTTELAGPDTAVTQPVTGSAWSTGGRRFELEAGVLDAPRAGMLLRLQTCDAAYLGQVHEAHVVRGPAGSGGRPRVAATGALLAEVSGVPAPVAPDARFEDAAASEASSELVASWAGSARRGPTALEIGQMQGVQGDLPALVDAVGFTRHTFLCGQSGSGKTFTLGLLLERLLLRTDLRLVVLDPNSDYVHLDDLAGAAGTAPPARLEEVRRGTRVLANRPGSTAALTVRFGRLPLDRKAMVLGLDPVRDAAEYDVVRSIADRSGEALRLETLLEELDADGGDTARRLAVRIRNLGVARWSVWAGPDDVPVMDHLNRVRAGVVDLGSLPTAEERSVVAAAVLTSLWVRREERRPTLVVVDEAHNVCPASATDPYQALAVDVVRRIAAEGRKYGLYLLLATQSPRRIHPDVLSQCDNLVLMRTTGAADVALLADVFAHVPRGLVGLAPEFGLGEGLLAGRLVPAPALFRSGRRWSREGGADVPTHWAEPAGLR